MTSPARTIQSNDYLRTLAITPDGARIVAGGGNDVVVWNTRTGHKLLGPLKGHSNTILSVAVSPDGSTFASGAYDKEIRIWDTETGHAVLGPLTGHTDYVRSVAFSPGGHLLVSGSDDKTIRIWDARTGQPVGVPIQAGSVVLSVAMSPDGTKLAAGCYGHTFRLYDTTAQTLLFQCVGHTNWVSSIAFSTDGRLLVSGSGDRTVRIWDAATGLSLGSPLHGHTNDVGSVVFSPDGRYIASGSHDGALRMWDARTRQAHGDQLLGHTYHVNAVAFTRDGRFLVSGCYDGLVKIWDMRSDVSDTQNSRQSNQNLEIEITSEMSLQDIMSCLSSWGCVDMSSWLGAIAVEDSRMTSLGDTYRCKLNPRDEAMVRMTRIYPGSSEEHRTSLTRAARDLCAWSKCRHPNVQPLLGLALFRDRICIVVGWETNGTLNKYLERHPEADRCAISVQVAEGLAHLHKIEVVHGDLKAANVFVSKDGVARVGGFGDAALQDEMAERSETPAKDVLSTRWAAPELFNDHKYTDKTDVYALGMTILEIIMGMVPWAGKSIHMLIYSTLEKANPERPIDHIPTGSIHGEILWSILRSCWKFEAEKRPSSATVASLMKCVTPEGLKAD
ncbi:WD repeat-containing protein [Ceratobasidium sp. AG-Ba]|nr:WD repeat-containing protein [Ceratobasidium sp. AG-Ba]